MSNRSMKLLAVGAVAAYLVWRIQEARGGPITFVSPFDLLAPGPPSTVRTEGDGQTNIFASVGNLLENFGRSLKTPGNASGFRTLAAAPGTNANPLAPPSDLILTAQPSPYEGLGPDVQYVPNLGDPNMTAFDFLASTPPDLAWGIEAGGGFFV
jgi:hypothetical protein